MIWSFKIWLTDAKINDLLAIALKRGCTSQHFERGFRA
jgi:hypothetical protein